MECNCIDIETKQNIDVALSYYIKATTEQKQGYLKQASETKAKSFAVFADFLEDYIKRLEFARKQIKETPDSV